MKQILFTLFIAAFMLGSTSYGQFQFSLGPRAGVNIANLSFDPEPQGVDIGTRLGFKFGALAELGFSPMFAVQIEPMYAMKGSELTAGSNSRKIKLTFIEIPVLFKVKFATGGAVAPYVFAGPNIGLTLSADLEDDINGQTSETDIKDETSSMDFAIDFGAGVGFMVSPGVVIIFDARYALGLSNLNDNPNDPDTKIKSTGIQLLLGAMFGLN